MGGEWVEAYLGIVLSVAGMECDCLEIETTVEVNCGDDVSFEMLTSAGLGERATKGQYSLQGRHDTTYSSTRRSTRGLRSVQSLWLTILPIRV